MKNHSTRKINLAAGLIASLLAFNCLAEVAQAASASPKSLTYESSLSDFKSINNDTAKQSASDSTNETQDIPSMDHSKMSPEEMKNMKAAPKKSAEPSKVKKLKPMTPPKKPMQANEAKPTEVKPEAPANPHQNHQM